MNKTIKLIRTEGGTFHGMNFDIFKEDPKCSWTMNRLKDFVKIADYMFRPFDGGPEKAFEKLVKIEDNEDNLVLYWEYDIPNNEKQLVFEKAWALVGDGGTVTHVNDDSIPF